MNLSKAPLTGYHSLPCMACLQDGWGGLQTYPIPVCTPFQGEFAVSFIAVRLSLDAEISCMTRFGQLDISKYNAKRGWKMLVS